MLDVWISWTSRWWLLSSFLLPTPISRRAPTRCLLLLSVKSFHLCPARAQCPAVMMYCFPPSLIGQESVHRWEARLEVEGVNAPPVHGGLSNAGVLPAGPPPPLPGPPGGG